MKERPILFSAPMVRALLAGTKTQTRRALRPQPSPELLADFAQIRHERGCTRTDEQSLADCVPCPYGQPGDRLWVREAWAKTQPLGLPWPQTMIVYREGDNRTDYGGPWKPSIHMPRAASRITLEVIGVRVQRLQDITVADALAEGIVPTRGGYGLPDGSHFHSDNPRESYWSLWESINGPCSVDSNPWVWVLEFRRITADPAATGASHE